MPRYWVIAPVESKPLDRFEKVWQFDLVNNLISIGWSELGDITKMSAERILEGVVTNFPAKPPQTQKLIANMLWAFSHEIALGDYVLARKGRKTLSAVGKVTRTAFYSQGKNPHLASAEYNHTNFLGVNWQEQPRDKNFGSVVFPMHTVSEIAESGYLQLLEGSPVTPIIPEAGDVVQDQSSFVLEKYLEDFIVSNFNSIFKGTLRMYEDEEGNDGQQYTTEIGPIDILAIEPKSNSFVILELKKGRPSDQVVGQVLRYMGWVKKNLCTGEQGVKGLIICRDPDPKLDFALSMTNNIGVRYYSVSFKLSETP